MVVPIKNAISWTNGPPSDVECKMAKPFCAWIPEMAPAPARIVEPAVYGLLSWQLKELPVPERTPLKLLHAAP